MISKTTNITKYLKAKSQEPCKFFGILVCDFYLTKFFNRWYNCIRTADTIINQVHIADIRRQKSKFWIALYFKHSCQWKLMLSYHTGTQGWGGLMATPSPTWNFVKHKLKFGKKYHFWGFFDHFVRFSPIWIELWLNFLTHHPILKKVPWPIPSIFGSYHTKQKKAN